MRKIAELRGHDSANLRVGLSVRKLCDPDFKGLAG